MSYPTVERSDSHYGSATLIKVKANPDIVQRSIGALFRACDNRAPPAQDGWLLARNKAAAN
jgi:hypothetical protein